MGDSVQVSSPGKVAHGPIGRDTATAARPRQAGQPPEFVQEAPRPVATSESVPLVDGGAQVEPETRPALREYQEHHIALRTGRGCVLRPLRHVVHQQAGDEMCRLSCVEHDSGLLSDDGAAAVGADDEAAPHPPFDAVYAVAHLRLPAGAHAHVANPTDENGARVLGGAAQGAASGRVAPAIRAEHPRQDPRIVASGRFGYFG